MSRRCGTRCRRRRHDERHHHVGGDSPRPGRHPSDRRRSGAGVHGVGRAGEGVSRLHVGHRRAERRPLPPARGRCDPRAGGATDAPVLCGRELSPVPRSRRAAERARRARCAMQDRALHHRRRSGRERGEDRARVHGPPRRGGLHRRLPRPDAAGADADRVEPVVPPELRAVRAGDLSRPVPVRIPGRHRAAVARRAAAALRHARHARARWPRSSSSPSSARAVSCPRRSTSCPSCGA